MRKFIVGAAAFAVVTLVAYLGLFQRAAIMSVFAQGKLAAEGYTAASTPSEALDDFRRAIRERNYEAAELYLGGEYAEQFHKGAKNAQKLGVALDNLASTMETTGTKSDKVKYVLRWLDPFPTDLKVVDVKQSGDKLAYATLAEDAGPLQFQGDFSDWRVDLRACRPLFRSVGAQVELRKEGDGGGGRWKIYLPVTPELRLYVDYLAENESNYANAVDRVKEDLKNDATTKESLENALKNALSESK
jgi:hypothetical protein